MNKKPRPLQGPERDEIAMLVGRIKRADEKHRQPVYQSGKSISEEDMTWAEEQKLPSEFFEFFEIHRTSEA